MKFRGLVSLLHRTPIFRFSEEKSKNKVFQFVKSAWKQTFPDGEEQVRQKYQKVKQQKRYSQQELDKIQEQTPEYLKKALVSSNQQPAQQKKGFKISSMIPESIRDRIVESAQYKEYQIFKQNLQEYATTREGPVANVGTAVYSKWAQGSPEARATELMRAYIAGFNIYDLENESTVIFKNAYLAFLGGKLSEIQLMASDQGYEYFSGHLKMFKNKKWKPKFTEIVFDYPSQLSRARVGENLIPKFDFTMKIINIYCFVDGEGNVVEGGEDRVEASVFQFTLTYAGEHVGQLGHPWTICEVKQIEKMKMLV